jgi:tryptophan-rich sensory protein
MVYFSLQLLFETFFAVIFQELRSKMGAEMHVDIQLRVYYCTVF